MKDENLKKDAEVLEYLTNGIAKTGLKLTAHADDGRRNSADNEERVIAAAVALLNNSEYADEYEIIVPSARCWYDIALRDKETGRLIPINIKISMLGAASDNVGSRYGMGYAITGLEPTKKCAHDDGFAEYIRENKDTNCDRDYYFIVLNKNDTSDCFWTSLKQIEVLTPNGNNPPYQACWKNNRNRVERTHEEGKAYIWGVYMDSLSKKMESVAALRDVSIN